MIENNKDLYKRYKNKKGSSKNLPSVVYIESVRGCPFSCVMCKPESTKCVKISEVLLNKIEPYYDDIDVLAIHGYGEPLLADIDYFIDKSIKHDFIIHMNTNGFLLNKKLTENLLQAKHSIRFSINAGKPETYYKIMGVDFEKVKEKIKYLVEKSNEKKLDNDYWFSFIVIKENIDEIEDFLKTAYYCGIKKVRFMRLMCNGKISQGNKIRNLNFKYCDQFNKNIVKIYNDNLGKYGEIAKDLGINIQFGSMDKFKNNVKFLKESFNKVSGKILKRKVFPVFRMKGDCSVPWFGQLNISQNGNVRLCCENSYILGNLYENDLFEIWNSDKMKNIRSSFNKGSIPKICGYCRGITIEDYPENSSIRKLLLFP